MKIVEIDIDQTASPHDLESEFGIKNLEKGDRLQILFSEWIDNEFIISSVVIVISVAIRKRFEEYSDNLLKDVFSKRSIVEIEREIKNDYNIELVIESKEDNERRRWQQFSQTALVKAYSFDEPEYSENMVKEPNPEYKKSETR